MFGFTFCTNGGPGRSGTERPGRFRQEHGRTYGVDPPTKVTTNNTPFPPSAHTPLRNSLPHRPYLALQCRPLRCQLSSAFRLSPEVHVGPALNHLLRHITYFDVDSNSFITDFRRRDSLRNNSFSGIVEKAMVSVMTR